MRTPVAILVVGVALGLSCAVPAGSAPGATLGPISVTTPGATASSAATFTPL